MCHATVLRGGHIITVSILPMYVLKASDGPTLATACSSLVVLRERLPCLQTVQDAIAYRPFAGSIFFPFRR